MAYKPSFGSKQLLPTPADILKANQQANEPDPRKRDVRLLQSINAAIPRVDLDVLAVINNRKNWIRGFDWRIEAVVPRGQTTAPLQEVERAAQIERRYRLSGLHNHHGTLLGAIYNGLTAIHINQWSVAGPDGHYPVDYEPVPSVELKRDPDAARKVARLIYPRYDEVERHTLMPYTDLSQGIIASYNPLDGIDDYYDGGLLRPTHYLTVLKHHNWYDWAKVGEKYGDPAKVVKYPRMMSVKKGEVEKAYEFLEQLATESQAAIPDDIKFELFDLVTKGASADMFAAFIDKVTSKQERILLGQDVVNLSHTVGTFAQAKESNKTTASNYWADLLWLENIISDQYVVADYTLNYGAPSTGLYPRFRFQTDEAEDFRANAMIVSTLRSAGYDLDDDEVSRRTGFVVRKSADPQIIIPE